MRGPEGSGFEGLGVSPHLPRAPFGAADCCASAEESRNEGSSGSDELKAQAGKENEAGSQTEEEELRHSQTPGKRGTKTGGHATNTALPSCTLALALTCTQTLPPDS